MTLLAMATIVRHEKREEDQKEEAASAVETIDAAIDAGVQDPTTFFFSEETLTEFRRDGT